MPLFRFDKAVDIARNAKAFLSPGGVIARGVAPNARNPAENSKALKKKLEGKNRELSQIKKELRAAKNEAERSRHKRRKKTVQQEIFKLERGLHATEEQRMEGEEPGTGALPDFVVIGGKKCGTTFLYHLLTLHPYVEHAAAKELHYFDRFFDEGVEWYRQCFPQPGWKNGRKTMTGEASPYMSHRFAPERMAEGVPQARLIALLRNPAERAYSDYQQVVRKGRESRSFEEAIGFEGASLDHSSKYLSSSVYVDQLKRWSKFFSEEQMLVLKSEDFFERPVETLKVVLEFLELPEWEPDASELPKKRNMGSYQQGMGPETRRRLEEYFEPHNKRLYDYLGVDFGW